MPIEVVGPDVVRVDPETAVVNDRGEIPFVYDYAVLFPQEGQFLDRTFQNAGFISLDSSSTVRGDAIPVTVIGNVSVFGNPQIQSITVGDNKGVVQFDASFNSGLDTIHLLDPAADWLAARSGSQVILTDGATEVRIPVGAAGMTLDFQGDTRTLVFDTGAGAITIGGQVIGVIPAHFA